MRATYLRGQHDERSSNENDHEELARPNVGREISVADRREGDDDIPERVEETKLLQTAALQVLDATHTANTIRHVHKSRLHFEIRNISKTL